MAKDESDPLNCRLGRKQQPLKARMVLSFSVVVSTAATILTILASIGFGTFFHKGLSGFSRQVNAFVKIGDFGFLVVQLFVVIVTAGFIVYLLFVYLSAVKVLRFVPCCGSPFVLFLASCSSHVFLVTWALILCLVSSITLVYLIFIGGIFSFCSLVDTQCFDFKVLIPAIVNRISSSKIDMVFCEEKKELLCSAGNNQIWTFIFAFLCALLTFAGSLAVQNCVVYGLGRRTAGRTKQDAYEMHPTK